MPFDPKAFIAKKQAPQFDPKAFVGNQAPQKEVSPERAKLNQVLESMGPDWEKSVGQLKNLTGKTASLLLNTVKAPVGAGMQAASGKPAYSQDELVGSINPWSTAGLPTLPEMAKRTGTPDVHGHDILPNIYYDEEHPAGLFKKGGWADPSLWGAAEVLGDPFTWNALGLGKAFSQLRKLSPIRVAMENPTVGALASAAAKRAELAPLAKQSMSGGLIEKLGNLLYGHQLLPVEEYALKRGKLAPADTLYDMGIKTPFGMRRAVKEELPQLGKAKGALIDTSTATGARGSAENMVGEAQNIANDLNATPDSAAKAEGKAMQAIVEEYKNRATPRVNSEIARDAEGNFILEGNSPSFSRLENTEPPSLKTAEDFDRVKRFRQGKANYNQQQGLDQSEKFDRALARGAKQETENVVGNLYPGAGEDLRELNTAYGTVETTAPKQQFVEGRANRQAHSLMEGSPLNSVLAVESLKGLLAKHLGTAYRLGTMPLGYGLRKAGESAVVGPILDSIIRQNLAQPAPSPWSLLEKEQ